MPLARKLPSIGSDEARRQRAELRISYGNKLSNMNLDRLRCRQQNVNATATAAAVTAAAAPTGSASLRRIASSFAQVSDVNCGSCAALPLEDSEDDVREELAEVLIRSEPFKCATKSAPESVSIAASAAKEELTTTASSITHRLHNTCCPDAVLQSRACERWNQIAGTVSSLFRVRRFQHAHPLSELRRLREQRDLLESFTRPFLYEDTK